MKTVKMEGGCACGGVRYALTAPPLIVHACHCRDCQRLTGSAFVLNVWIEGECVEVTAGTPRTFRLKGGTGKDHEVFFCGACGTYLWSRYHAAPGHTYLLRAMTLDDPRAVRPDVHIFTRSKLPWFELPEGAVAFESFYDLKKVWPPQSWERFQRNVARHAAAAA